MTSPPAIQLMRFAFLALLWLFLFGLVRVIRAELHSSGLPRVQVSSPGRRKESRKAAAARTPRPPRGTPTQLVITEGGLAGTTIALSNKAILIGRANDSTLVLADDFASTRHARISELNGTWYVEDLGSTNGTYVGTKKVDGPMPIETGVAIRIGRTVMELR